MGEPKKGAIFYELPEVKTDFEDGHYQYDQVRSAIKPDFKTEKELCNYIERNIELFCSEILGVRYKNHSREYPLLANRARHKKGNRRIDFLIITDKDERIGIECKNPTNIADLQYAIGQALTYLTVFESNSDPLHSIHIVSTRIDCVLPSVLRKFKLPVGFIVMDKSKHLTYQHASA